jgi:hypothetical protein
MKTLFLLLLTAACCFGQGFDFTNPAFVGAIETVTASSPPVTYLVEENCEGTGTPSGWTDSGTVNWDYTTTALQGTQSRAVPSGGDFSNYTIADQSTVEFYCQFQFHVLPNVRGTMAALRTSGDSAVCLFRLGTDGTVSVYADGSDSTATVGAMSVDTKYHVWMRFVSGGTCTIAFSTDGTRPTSGNNFTSKTGGVANAGLVRLQGITETGANTIWDRILVLDGAIGSNP